jgi:hypothetical protein
MGYEKWSGDRIAVAASLRFAGQQRASSHRVLTFHAFANAASNGAAACWQQPAELSAVQIKEPIMNISFGIYAWPSSVAWDDIRKGPPLEAVREHLDRLVNFGRYRALIADRLKHPN